MFGGSGSNNSPGTGNSSTGSIFTSPFAQNISVSSHADAEKAKNEPSADGHHPIVRPSIFGQAVGELVKDLAVPKTTSPPSNDTSTLQSLYATDIPTELMDKTKLMEHFSQFGNVTRIYLHPARKSCTLHFDSHETAERVKTLGTTIGKSAMQIFWAKPASLRRSEGRRTSTSKISPKDSVKDDTKLKGVSANRRSLSSVTRKSVLPDEVKEELRAMMNPDALSFGDMPVKSLRKPEREGKVQTKQLRAIAKSRNEQKPTSTRESSPGASSISKSAVLGAGDMDIGYGSTASVEELQSVMRLPANTAEERYRVLEARDKLLRLKRVRQFTLATARNNRGTCPDMCPEKERYLREFQRQVASYEHTGVPGKMDHKKAVKQYSRSSADQEEPLSHELRPASVLRLTMDYLIWTMMDICNRKDENIADWYHFIWDRTRGIRKDITQQELCDENSVTLVEQCARWHIVCSERLIAEDLSVYDDNINTENLTKCLQTLKYMYQDLDLKGISCPNEAEFRAYFVLLNLNEGDCMWEVQQLRSEIRESEPVRFALQVSAALASNNYIRFFKLVRASTYLNACILHRYFAQVRSHALDTIVKAFCSRTAQTVFTLEEIVKLAGLENAQEAATLCMHHGLRLTEDRNSVIMSRNSFSYPDTPLPATRVLSLVEAKRKCSVGEVVNGGAQISVTYATHIPHDSFDAKGFLKQRAWTAKDQDLENRTDDEDVEVEQMKPDDSAEREEAMKKAAVEKQIREMKIAKMYREVLEQVTNNEVCSVVQQCMKTALVDSAAAEFSDEVIGLVTSEMINHVCSEVYQSEIEAEKQRVLAERLAAEAEMLRKMQEKKFLQELHKYLDEFMEECANNVIQYELDYEQAQIELRDELIETFVQEECKNIAVEAIDETRAKEADALQARIMFRHMKCFFQHWRSATASAKSRKQCMADFPAWMSNLTLAEQVSDLDQPDPFLIENMNRNRFASFMSKRLALEQEPPPLPMLDIGPVVVNQLLTRMKEMSNHEAYIYWKMFISVPDMEEAPLMSKLVQTWTNAIFSLKAEEMTSVCQIKPSVYETVTMCIRRLIGGNVSADETQGTNGVLFWFSHKDSSAQAHQRMTAILRSKPKLPAIPIAVILSGSSNKTNQQIYRDLNLQSLREAGYVSTYKLFPRQNNTAQGLLAQIEASCQWLAGLCPSQPSLVVTSLQQLLDQYLGQELWLQAKSALKDQQQPNMLVDLYNSIVSKITDLLCDKTLFDHSLGGNEFKKYVDDKTSFQEQRGFQIAPDNWGSSLYLPTIMKVLSDAKISKIESWPPQTHRDLQDLLVQYCTTLNVPHAITSVYQIIERHATIQAYVSKPASSPSLWKNFLKTVPWIDVMETIVAAKLRSLDYSSVSMRDSGQVDIRVVVDRQKLAKFEESMWWISTEMIAFQDSLCDVEEEKTSQKRVFEDETPQPRKQQRLSLNDSLPDIKSSFKNIDTNMEEIRATWAEVAAKWGKQSN